MTYDDEELQVLQALEDNALEFKKPDTAELALIKEFALRTLQVKGLNTKTSELK